MDWGIWLPSIAAAGAVLALLQWRSRSLHARLRQAHKQLKEREALLRQSESRLEEFLGALQESPNGVILLDERARIEWCNQTAAAHFGLDPERDREQYIGNLVRDPAFAAYMTSWNDSRDVVLSVPGPGAAPLKLAVQWHAYAGHRRRSCNAWQAVASRGA